MSRSNSQSVLGARRLPFYSLFFVPSFYVPNYSLKEGAKNPESRKQITRRILLQIKCRARQKFFFCFLALRTLLLLFCIGKFVRNTSSFLSKCIYLDIYISFDFGLAEKYIHRTLPISQLINFNLIDHKQKFSYRFVG